jgi:hypothetical protein
MIQSNCSEFLRRDHRTVLFSVVREEFFQEVGESHPVIPSEVRLVLMIADRTPGHRRLIPDHHHGLRQLQSHARRRHSIRSKRTLRTSRPTHLPANARRATRTAADATSTAHAASPSSPQEKINSEVFRVGLCSAWCGF